MKFTLNHHEVEFTGDPQMVLIDYLREQAGLTSVKRGCDYEGVCGACSVLVDGRSVSSCRLTMAKVAGCTILTVEGIESSVLDALATAFGTHGAVQCGFCTPGIVISAAALLRQTPTPSREEVLGALKRHICRCTGYHAIIAGIMEAAALIQKKIPSITPPASAGVGMSYPKYACRCMVEGSLQYVDDMRPEGLLFGALKLSDHPRARLLTLDVSEALRVPGVVRIFTAGDIPGSKKVGLIKRDWNVMIGVGETTCYIGDVIAGVVAESRETARKAVGLIKAEYEVYEPVTDIFEALKPGAVQVHPDGNQLSRSVIKIGDAEAALQASAHVVKGRYTTQRIEHAFMEPESALALPVADHDRIKLTLYSQTQGAYEDRKGVSEILGLHEEAVQVIQVQTGGGFGGKEDMTVQGHAALFAYLLQKPVNVTLSRTESLLMHSKRHPFVLDYELGCDEKGLLTALRARIYCDSGAYASVGMKVLERAASHSAGAYSVPVVDVEGVAVYTNNVPCGAMRGFGVNQSAFAMENCMEQLCIQGGFDRWQFRYDNAVDNGRPLVTGQIMKEGVGVRTTLLALKDEFYKARRAGLACGIKNTGIGNGMPDIGRCKVEIVAADKVVLHHGWTEMGQGIHTIALQSLCEETDIDPRLVEVRVDTAADVVCGMTTASRGTSLVGNAVIEACRQLKEDLKTMPLSALVGRSYRGEWRCDFTTKIGSVPPEKEVTHYSYGYASQLVVLGDDGKIEKVVAAHDAGRVMNPTLFKGQIEGAVHMGLGYALSEEFPMQDGRPLNLKFGRLGIIKPAKMVPVEVRPVEVRDPHGPFGAKGVGEIGLVPTAAAVALAGYQLDKKWRHTLPMKDLDLL
jgi:selenium-dependent xanthine dehydrogenase